MRVHNREMFRNINSEMRVQATKSLLPPTEFAPRKQERGSVALCFLMATQSVHVLVDPHSVSQNAHLGNGGENNNRNL